MALSGLCRYYVHYRFRLGKVYPAVQERSLCVFSSFGKPRPVFQDKLKRLSEAQVPAVTVYLDYIFPRICVRRLHVYAQHLVYGFFLRGIRSVYYMPERHVPYLFLKPYSRPCGLEYAVHALECIPAAYPDYAYSGFSRCSHYGGNRIIYIHLVLLFFQKLLL